MNAGFRIREERMALAMSQQELADRANKLGGEISQSGIHRIEERDSKRPRYIKEIALVLNVTEDWLIYGKLPKHRPLDSALLSLVNEIRTLPERDQNMVMANIRSSIDTSRAMGATFDTTQGNIIKSLRKK